MIIYHDELVEIFNPPFYTSDVLWNLIYSWTFKVHWVFRKSKSLLNSHKGLHDLFSLGKTHTLWDLYRLS